MIHSTAKRLKGDVLGTFSLRIDKTGQTGWKGMFCAVLQPLLVDIRF